MDPNIYNADETGLFFKHPPAKAHPARTNKHVKGKNGKNRVTVPFRPNADGLDKPPGHRQGGKPQSFIVHARDIHRQQG